LKGRRLRKGEELSIVERTKEEEKNFKGSAWGKALAKKG